MLRVHVRPGNVAAVRIMKRHGLDIMEFDAQGMNAFHRACRGGQVGMCAPVAGTALPILWISPPSSSSRFSLSLASPLPSFPQPHVPLSIPLPPPSLPRLSLPLSHTRSEVQRHSSLITTFASTKLSVYRVDMRTLIKGSPLRAACALFTGAVQVEFATFALRDLGFDVETRSKDLPGLPGKTGHEHVRDSLAALLYGVVLHFARCGAGPRLCGGSGSFLYTSSA